LYLFDSFAELHPWKREVEEIMKFVVHLTLLANQNGHPLHIVTDDSWKAWPLAVSLSL